jgi:hypothetical protein
MAALKYLHNFPMIVQALHADRHLISHTQARTFARVSHPDELMDGESYNVDLQRPYFTGLYNGEFSSGGPAQLIGTFNTDDNTWLWGFENPSIHANGWSALRPALDTINALAPLLAERKLALDDETQAMCLATWIARKAGYLGAYPAPVGNAIAFLAVKLARHPEASTEPDDQRWCTLCGCTQEQVALLLAGEHGFVCDECVDNFESVVPTDRDANTNYNVANTMSSCVLCDADTTPRVMTTYSSLCWECIGTAAGILKERREAGVS